MRTYTIKKQEHIVYEGIEEFPKDMSFLKDWREGDVGDWVLSDDECIIQVLRTGHFAQPKSKVKSIKYVGTCTGTFICRNTVKMDCDKRANIYNISGKHPKTQIAERNSVTQKEQMFAQFMAEGMKGAEAYLRAFDTKSKHYANAQAGLLLKQERIKRAMKEELKPVLKALNINNTRVLEGIRDIALSGEEKASDRLKALFELADILEIKETKKEITAIGGAVFKGFLPDHTEVLETRKELIEGRNDSREE